VVDLRKAAESDSNFPTIIYFHQGSVAEGDTFFEAYDPPAIAVSDPKAKLYAEFGLGKANLRQLFAPEVWACGIRATLKGHGIGRPVGDPLMMPGYFVVQGDQILMEYRPRHVGDHPVLADFSKAFV
jgi:hypothetical protein